MVQTKPVLRRNARKMVYDVYCFMKNEAKTEKEKVRLTSEATKTSERTVRRIVKEGKSDEIRTPGKTRNKGRPITDIDTFDQFVIRTSVHNYHVVNKDLPTVEKLRKKLKDDINFKGSERSLRTIITNLGFRWRKIEKNKKILIEKSSIRLLRIEYLEKLFKYRQEGRPIVYTDETFVISSDSGSQSLSDDSTKKPKATITKGRKLVILHAGSEDGFIPSALCSFETGSKSDDDNLNHLNYEKWLRYQLIPSLPPNAVIVIADAFYNNKQADPAPTSNAKRADMKRWLTVKGIAYEDDMLKPQLYKLIKLNKGIYKRYKVDDIIAENNHSVLRLPLYHSDLNPLKMAWAEIKDYVSSQNITWNETNIMQLVKQKIELMLNGEWSNLCSKVKIIEADYIKSDHIVDSITEQFLVYGSDDSDSSDSESDMSQDEGDEPVPSTSSTSGDSCFVPVIKLLESSSDDSVII